MNNQNQNQDLQNKEVLRFLSDNIYLIKDIVYHSTVGRPSHKLFNDICHDVYLNVYDSIVRHPEYLTYYETQDADLGFKKIEKCQYLSTIITNSCIDRLRSIKRKNERIKEQVSIYKDFVEEEEPALIYENTEDEIIENFEKENLIKKIKEQVSDKSYELLKSAAEGMSYEELSEIYNLPIGTIKSRINRIRKLIRDSVSEKD